MSNGNTTRTFDGDFPGRVVVGAGSVNSAAIIIQNCEIRDFEKGEPKYSGKNAEIALVVGVNGPDWNEDTPITYINYGKTPAGLVISERTTPAFVFAQDERGVISTGDSRVPRMLNIPYKISDDGVPEADPKVAEAINSAEPTLTAWGGTINLASFNGGINLYTKPFYMKSKARGDHAGNDSRNFGMGKTGVSLINGNSIKTLEPMVRGNSLATALNNQNKDMQDALNQIHDIHLSFMELIVAFAGHTHLVAAPLGAGMAAPSVEGMLYAIKATVSQITAVIDNVFGDINTVFEGFNVSMACSSSYLSDFHRLN